MQQTGFMVTNMKSRQFAQVMQDMTTAAQEVEAPKHSGKRGLLLNEVVNIASHTNVAENWAQCISGLPMPDNKGGVFLYPHQLVKMLKRRLSMPGLLPEVLFEALIAEGVKIKEKKIGGRAFWYLEDLSLLEHMDEEKPI